MFVPNKQMTYYIKAICNSLECMNVKDKAKNSSAFQSYALTLVPKYVLICHGRILIKPWAFSVTRRYGK